MRLPTPKRLLEVPHDRGERRVTCSRDYFFSLLFCLEKERERERAPRARSVRRRRRLRLSRADLEVGRPEACCASTAKRPTLRVQTGQSERASPESAYDTRRKKDKTRREFSRFQKLKRVGSGPLLLSLHGQNPPRLRSLPSLSLSLSNPVTSSRAFEASLEFGRWSVFLRIARTSTSCA